jgi:hypothetical protein
LRRALLVFSDFVHRLRFSCELAIGVREFALRLEDGSKLLPEMRTLPIRPQDGIKLLVVKAAKVVTR